MSEVKINKTESDDCVEIIMFLENLSPELKEKFKAIILWENMKKQDKPQEA